MSDKPKVTETTLSIKYQASELNFSFPKTDQLTDEEQENINRAIVENGIVTPDLRTAVNKKGVKKLLATDQKGVNKIYNDLDNDDKIENGDEKYIRTPALIKEISERSENLYDPLTKAKLDHSKKALDELSNNKTVEDLRQVEKARNDKQLSQVKQKIIKKSDSTDALTGQHIDNGEVHHIERVADNPRRQNDSENMIYTSPENHKQIHRHNAESEDALQILAAEEGWIPPKTD